VACQRGCSGGGEEPLEVGPGAHAIQPYNHSIRFPRPALAWKGNVGGWGGGEGGEVSESKRVTGHLCGIAIVRAWGGAASPGGLAWAASVVGKGSTNLN